MTKKNKKTILVTGAAGFIGAATVLRLLKDGYKVLGVDNLNNYYDVSLKGERLKNINKFSKFSNLEWEFFQISIEDNNSLVKIFENNIIDIVINLAAQAGVRYSVLNPHAYLQSNIFGFLNILENCRKFNIQNLIYASSSSVYGGNKVFPFKEVNPADHPVSFYAVTKRTNEMMAHSYSHLYGLQATGLRFFTVYGPWGRPDMAPMLFSKSIMEEKPINVFNYGEMVRDFTYIDDIVDGITKCCKKPATIDEDFNFIKPNPSTSFAPHRIFNIGNNTPIKLTHFIELLEKNLGKKANKIMQPLQNGDIVETVSNTDLLKNWVGYKSKTSFEKGINKFTSWFLNYYEYI